VSDLANWLAEQPGPRGRRRGRIPRSGRNRRPAWSARRGPLAE
jgi:hypothetical protein